LEKCENEKAKIETELAVTESNRRTSVLTEEEIKSAYLKAHELFLKGDIECEKNHKFIS
jgi:hypothetical protein